MALLSRKEFSLMCGITPAYVGVYVKRNKIIELNKKIDTDNVLNKIFLDSCLKEKEVKKEKVIETIYEDVVEKVEVKKVVPIKKDVDYSSKKYGSTKEETPTQKRKRAVSNKESLDVSKLDLRKKKADTLKAEREAELKLLDITKKNGEALPTDFVIMMTKTLIRTMLVKFDSSTVRIAGKFCDIVGADRLMLTRVNKALSEIMQEIIKEAESVSKKDIENAIKEYSIKKSKGERERI